MKHFLDKLFVKDKVSLAFPMLQLVCLLPYAGNLFLNLKALLRLKKNLPFRKLTVVLRSSCRLGNLFRFKDSLEEKILSEGVYCSTCSNCSVTYYGKLSDIFLMKRLNAWDLRI